MIIINNEELLKKPCAEVLPNEVGELVDLLERELDNSARLGSPGIGLAAPQIGIYKKIAIVRINKELKLNLINAKIEKAYDEAMFRGEGCLSFPGRIEDTKRYQEIQLSTNIDRPQKIIATGLLAVCCQHELDHLDGILLPDRAIKKQITIPDRNEVCFCGSNKKYKKCCGKI